MVYVAVSRLLGAVKKGARRPLVNGAPRVAGGLAGGSPPAKCTFVYTQLMIFMEIRYQVLAARMDMQTAALNADAKINPFDAMNFVGVSVANTYLALNLLIFVLWALCFPFCYPMISRVIANYLTENWAGLLIVLLPALITGQIKAR